MFLCIQIKRSCGSIFGIFVYIKNKNLGRVSDLKINFVELDRSFPDFFINQTGKKGQNFHFGIGKVVQNGKKGQNFQFGKKK